MTSWADRRRLFIDLETFSSEDISKAGAFKYAEAEDFEILLLAYAYDHDEVKVIDLTTIVDPDEVLSIVDDLCDPNVVKVAHNSAFERVCLQHWTGEYLPPEEWEDTMVLAAMNGLPMSLDAAGAALNLKDQKIKEGTSLISYFCKPCRPTIANGGRTRNRPEHAPDKWARFVEYCRRDVEVEQAIYYRLNSYKVTDFEREVWALDARINERGVLVDTELAEAAIAVDEEIKAAGTAELKKLTGLDNPNSVAQLKDWLETVGMPCDSLSKSTMDELKAKATDPTTRRVLELRQMLGKTSTKKYQAMLTAACKDNRVRGIMQYYGAGRTGRWAGRIVQPQNLPQNHLDDIDKVRTLVRAQDIETLELAFDSVPDVLSQLIRTALIAKPGHTFLVADYSAIEARVIAYLAGEKWRQEVFASGGDIYCSSASAMFKVPVEKHGVNGHLRQKGKIAELACIAEGTEILTDRGLVPIEKVTKGMRLWDGVDWVRHRGVVCKEVKEVISYAGLEATTDHIVWAEIEGKHRQIRFGDAAASGARLLRSGDGRSPIRLGGSYKLGEKMEPELESLLCPDRVSGMRGKVMEKPWKPADGKVKRLPKLLAEKSSSDLADESIHRRKTAMHQPQGRELQELRSKRHRVSVPVSYRCGGIHDRDVRNARQNAGAGQNRRERPLRTRKSPMGYASAELSEPTTVPRKVKVYDIVNAGPRHRYTAANVLVHNCGYGGGVGALKAFGADKMGLTETEMQSIVDQWRAASPTIPRFWRDAENAAKRAIEHLGQTFSVPCGVKYRRDADGLRCQLPSGRVLTYWGAHLEDGSIVFMGQNQTTRKWEKTQTWGGRLVENIVQAYARDCLAVALVRLAEAGYEICFHVHDEIIAEAPEGSRWEDMAAIMGQPIDWAPGLLLRAEGYETGFYKKE